MVWYRLISFVTILFVCFNCIDSIRVTSEIISGSECETKICCIYSYHHKEGLVYRTNCSNNLNDLPISKCSEISYFHNKTSMCFHNGDQETCCCLAQSDTCQSGLKNFEKSSIYLRMNDIKTLIFCSIMLIVYCILISISMKNRLISNSKTYFSNELNMKQHRVSKYHCWKILVLVLMITSLWIPIRSTCSMTKNGEFANRYRFVAHIFENRFLGLFISIFSFFPLYIEIIRPKHTNIRNHTENFLLASFLTVVVLFLGLSILHTYLTVQENVTTYLCTVTHHLYQLAVAGCSAIIYVLLVVFGEVFFFILQKGIQPNLKIQTNDIISESSYFNSQIELSCKNSETEGMYTCIENEEDLIINPMPLFVNHLREGILTLRNWNNENWIALRIKALKYDKLSFSPTHIILPPKRESTVLVQLNSHCSNDQLMMIQWFNAGSSCPSRDANQIWERPHYTKPSEWKYYVLRVSYHSSEAR